MGGLWGALTWQGKTLVVGALLVALLIVGLISRRGSGPSVSGEQAPSGQAVSNIGQPLTQPAPQSAFSTPLPAVASAPTVATVTPVVTPTSLPATSTPAPTERPPATLARPPATAAPPPPPPTVAPVACQVAASVANPNPAGGSAETVNAKLTCNGAGVAGAALRAVIHYPSASAACSGVSDTSGSASCLFVTASAPPGSTISIDACLTRREGDVYCGQTGYTTP